MCFVDYIYDWPLQMGHISNTFNYTHRHQNLAIWKNYHVSFSWCYQVKFYSMHSKIKMFTLHPYFHFVIGLSQQIKYTVSTIDQKIFSFFCYKGEIKTFWHDACIADMLYSIGKCYEFELNVPIDVQGNSGRFLFQKPHWHTAVGFCHKTKFLMIGTGMSKQPS